MMIEGQDFLNWDGARKNLEPVLDHLHLNKYPSLDTADVGMSGQRDLRLIHDLSGMTVPGFQVNMKDHELHLSDHDLKHTHCCNPGSSRTNPST